MALQYYSVRERIQMLRWHYSGKTPEEIISLFGETFGGRDVPNLTLLSEIVNLFENNGNINNCQCPHKNRPLKNCEPVELNGAVGVGWDELISKTVEANPKIKAFQIASKYRNHTNKLSTAIVKQILSDKGYERICGVWVNKGSVKKELWHSEEVPITDIEVDDSQVFSDTEVKLENEENI